MPSPPDDTVEALKFNPQIAGQPVLLVSGSWDSVIRVWQISENGQCEAKAQQSVTGPVLDVDWIDVCLVVILSINVCTIVLVYFIIVRDFCLSFKILNISLEVLVLSYILFSSVHFFMRLMRCIVRQKSIF